MNKVARSLWFLFHRERRPRPAQPRTKGMYARRFWLTLYRLGLYKAWVAGDGVTDDRRAIQARIDADQFVLRSPADWEQIKADADWVDHELP